VYQAELVKTLKEQAGLSTLAQTEAAYEKLFAILGAVMKKGYAVGISGFGSSKLSSARHGKAAPYPSAAKSDSILPESTIFI